MKRHRGTSKKVGDRRSGTSPNEAPSLHPSTTRNSLGGVSGMSQARLALLFLAGHLVTALWFLLDRSPNTGAALVGLPLDDAWIHMVYARSLAALHGFAYNPGQLETGSTSPLWAVLLVPASWTARLLHLSVAIPAKVTTLLTAVAASLATARLLRALGFGIVVQIVAGLIIAADPSLAFAQVSGMEVMLAGTLALWTLGDLANGRYRAAGIAAGLAPLARPEMALLTVGVLVFVERRLHAEQAPVKMRLQVLLPTVLAVGGWVTYCLLVTGYPMPSTFYVKAREDSLAYNLAIIFGEILPASSWFYYGAGAILWVAGVVVVWRRGAVGRMMAVFPLVYFLGVSSSQLMTSGGPFYYLRYVLPAQTFVVVIVAMGAVVLLDWAWKNRRKSTRAVGVSVLVAVSLMRLPSSLAERAHLFAWNCQNIEELNVAMSLWLRDNVPAGEAIIVNDAGAAGYFTEHRIFDIVGLNNHRWLHREPGTAAELTGARYASFFPSLIPQIANSPTWHPIHRSRTEHLTICKDCLQSEIVAYRRVVPPP